MFQLIGQVHGEPGSATKIRSEISDNRQHWLQEYTGSRPEVCENLNKALNKTQKQRCMLQLCKKFRFKIHFY